MTDTKLHRLFNYIEQGKYDSVKQYAEQNPYLLAISSSSYEYKTPICYLADKQEYDIALYCAKLNLDALSEDCDGFSGNNIVFDLVYKDIETAYKFAELNKDTVNIHVIKSIILTNKEYVVQFTKLNPEVLYDNYSNYEIIPNLIKEGLTELANDMIDIAENYDAKVDL
ncbi:MAG: hypothetical protein ACI8ZF_000821 [Candidatus Midichloriaceae bacterium]|jgi:hypothetical protein